MDDGLTVKAKAVLAVEEPGEGGGMVERTGWKFLGVLGITLLWNLLEGEVLELCPEDLSTTSTSSQYSSSLPSASGSVLKFAVHLILFTTPSVLILEMGTSELEEICLPSIGMGPPALVQLAISLFLEPVTNTRYQYHNQSRKSPYLQLKYPEVPSWVGSKWREEAIYQCEPNQLRMPEPQIADSGGTEGEDSVSLVSLELMTRDYGRRRIQAVRLCTSRVWGHNSFYGLLKVLNVGLQGPLRPKSTIQNLPFSSGEVTFLDGPGPPSMGPGHINKN
ncbi:hypothetical protein O181_039691 [Austropuccinia psidii MF-1]|uniref:Uncharacterized protein n=1 Tax=Austropuccinia psidii MF-1 TaxID=1389203 RepID=A0A9Q3HCR1_9BASI|nr:hypothetical protein [Austropuccinia psidii MF-1]